MSMFQINTVTESLHIYSIIHTMFNYKNCMYIAISLSFAHVVIKYCRKIVI